MGRHRVPRAQRRPCRAVTVLSELEYGWLLARAEREHRSIGATIREILLSQIRPAAAGISNAPTHSTA